MLALIGLILIVLAWIIQLAVLMKKKKSKTINKWFILVYMIGALVLTYDGFTGGATSLAIANLVAVIVAFLVLIKLKK